MNDLYSFFLQCNLFVNEPEYILYLYWHVNKREVLQGEQPTATSQGSENWEREKKRKRETVKSYDKVLSRRNIDVLQ